MKIKNNKTAIKKAIKLMGKKPINPIGECFESSTLCLLSKKLNKDIINLKNVRLCHGIGISDMYKKKGIKIAHGWIEYTHEDKKGSVEVAIDTTWGIQMPASIYREQLKLTDIIKYTPQEALENWKKSVAPWDKKLKQIIDKNGQTKQTYKPF